ncbi:hypothetical protein ACJROX_04425 [Pseudalkalibacillus sp. A8]|uniref:hypothetical protein n=1 Tax=Pseudalkalibacillus sp. A8 TaxID=3382641 RepID=UPI0038B5EA24
MDSKNNKSQNKQKLHNQKEPEHTLHEDETVDPMPVEDQKQEIKEERNKHQTKDDSSSERRYRKNE